MKLYWTDHQKYGVICKSENRVKWDKQGYYEYFANATTLPEPVSVWAGLLVNNQHNPYVAANKTLSELNDEGASFVEIAKIIDNKL